MSNSLRKLSKLFSLTHVALPILLAISVAGPLFYNDFSLLIYQQSRAVRFFSAFHEMWGYDPTYSAGLPLNFTWNSNVFLQLLAVVFHPVPEYVVLLVATVLSIAIAPICFSAGLANFGVKGKKRDAALILMLSYWWCGFMAVLMQIGMPTALTVFHLSFYTVSLFYRYLNNGEDHVVAKLYIFGPLCFLVHKTAIVTLALPVLILLICNPGRLFSKKVFHLALIAGLTIAVNSFWVVPFIHLVKYKVALPEAPHGLCVDSMRIYKDYFSLSKIMGHKVIGPENGAAPILLVNTILKWIFLLTGLAGVAAISRKSFKTALCFLLTVVSFFALVYFGSLWEPAALLNPTRYVAYADFLLAVPAAFGIAAIGNLVLKKFEKISSLPTIVSVAVLILFALSVLPYGFFMKQMSADIDKDTKALAAFLSAETTPSGRVLLEDSGWNDRESLEKGTPPKYGGGHFPSLLADITGREFIGGPYPYVFLSQHYADFHDGSFLRKPINEFTTDELLYAMDIFNIRWIVCWSAECDSVFGGAKDSFRLVREIGKFNAYERSAKNFSGIKYGSGFVRADEEGLKIFRADPEGESVVIKYQYFETLKTSGGKLFPYETAFGGDGLIEISAPPQYFTISNSYKFKRYNRYF